MTAFKERDAHVLQVATDGWSYAYRDRSVGDRLAMRICARGAMGMQTDDDEEVAPPVADEYAHSVSVNLYHGAFVFKWVDAGRPQLCTTHKYAAAMMATNVHPSMRADIHVPWKAFRVQIPDGLLDVEGQSFRVIDVAQFELDAEDDSASMAVLGETLDGRQIAWAGCRAASIADLLTNVDEDRFDMDGLDVLNVRTLVMAQRLVVGLLWTMQHTNNFRERVYGRGRGESREPPPHRVISIGRPLNVDCRPAIGHYLGGNGASPSVQSLVRGHYKRQVLGIGRTGRKVIWIEPYWRGPEDAPILSRPYKVGPK